MQAKQKTNGNGLGPTDVGTWYCTYYGDDWSNVGGMGYPPTLYRPLCSAVPGDFRTYNAADTSVIDYHLEQLAEAPPPQLPVAALVIETAFSNRESDLARRSQHLSPTTLAAELALRAPTASYPIYITHTKPSETELILQEIKQLELAEDVEIGWLQAGQVFEV